MAPPHPPLIDEARPFGAEEVFFSRTDGRGVILSGNAVFQRISDYAWDDLIGAPHKRIRHPHMPRGVFHLFWERLEAGKPIGAYVKNRAADGRHYWVYAVACPVEGGYLSVRCSATSRLFRSVRAEYEALRGAEDAGGLPPEQSAKRLRKRLRRHGFESYDEFMATALAAEIAACDTAAGRPPAAEIARTAAILERMREAKRWANALIDVLEETDIIPHNVHIRAAKLGPAGLPLSVIAQNHQALAGEIERAVTDLRATLARTHETCAKALFLVGAARLQGDVASAFSVEDGLPEAIDRAAEDALLNGLVADYGAKAASALKNVSKEIRRFVSVCQELRRVVIGLDITRSMCRRESTLLAGNDGTLDGIVDHLGRFHEEVSGCLAKLEAVNGALTSLCRPRKGVGAVPPVLLDDAPDADEPPLGANRHTGADHGQIGDPSP